MRPAGRAGPRGPALPPLRWFRHVPRPSWLWRSSRWWPVRLPSARALRFLARAPRRARRASAHPGNGPSQASGMPRRRRVIERLPGPEAALLVGRALEEPRREHSGGEWGPDEDCGLAPREALRLVDELGQIALVEACRQLFELIRGLSGIVGEHRLVIVAKWLAALPDCRRDASERIGRARLLSGHLSRGCLSDAVNHSGRTTTVIGVLVQMLHVRVPFSCLSGSPL